MLIGARKGVPIQMYLEHLLSERDACAWASHYSAQQYIHLDDEIEFLQRASDCVREMTM